MLSKPDQPVARGRLITILMLPQFELLDVTGPCSVFANANELLKLKRATPGAHYELVLLAPGRAGPLASSAGPALCADVAFERLRRVPDTLLIAGGEAARSGAAAPKLHAWLRELAPRVRRLGSICTGAFVLAATGLLDGRRATTHWLECERLARSYPKVRVERDPIFVHDGIYSSAGISAGMDLALHMVSEDHGRKLALSVARLLVLYLKRPGGQSQFSVALTSQLAARDGLRDIQTFVSEHLPDDLRVEVLAARAGMSPRHFAREFKREVGSTPAEFVLAARIEAARRWLEESADGIAQIAQRCGFGDERSLRRAFVRKLAVSPNDYRRRFG